MDNFEPDPNFYYKRSISVHEDAVRNMYFNEFNGLLYTGSYDKFIKKTDILSNYESVGLLIDNPSWVTCVVSTSNGIVISGNKGGEIHIYSDEERPVIFDAHTGGVVSLSLNGKNQIISGGWDGYMKMWDMNGQLLFSFHTNENAVSVLSLDNYVIVGTTGRQDGESGTVNARIIDFKLRLFLDGNVIDVNTDNFGPVRFIDRASGGFLTTSNDGTLRVFTIIDNRINNILTMSINQDDDKAHFLLQGREIQQLIKYVGISEDGLGYVWNNQVLTQTIQFPTGLWSCIYLPCNGDIVFGANNGTIIIFTNDVTQIAQEEELKSFKSLADVFHSSSNQFNTVDISQYPDISTLHSTTGRRDNDVQIFVRDGKAISFMWNMASSTWMEIGEVFAVGRSKGKDGNYYDKVLPVQIEGAQGTYELCFNYDENPYTVANDFIGRHQLDPSFVPEILEYINKNRSSNVITQTNQAQNSVNKTKFTYFPSTEPYVFNKQSIKGIEKKMDEFYSLYNVDIDDIKVFKDLFIMLNNTSFYHVIKVSNIFIELINKYIDKFPGDNIFILYDIIRHISIIPDGKSILTTDYRFFLIKMMKKSKECLIEPYHCIQIFIKLLCNLSNYGKSLIYLDISEVLDYITFLVSLKIPQILLLVGSLLYNIGIYIYRNGEIDSDTSLSIVDLCMKIILLGNLPSSELCLYAIGNIVLNSPKERKTQISNKYTENAELGVLIGTNDKLTNIVREIQSM